MRPHRILSTVLSLSLVALIALAAPPKKGNAKSATPTRSTKIIKAEKQATAKEIKETTQKIDDNKRETSRQVNELNLITAEIAEANEHISHVKSSVDSINRSIVDINQSIAKHEADIKKLRESYAKALKGMQGRRISMNRMAFLFSSGNFNQGYRRLRYLRELAKWNKRKTDEIRAAQASLKEQQNKLASAQSARSASLRELNTAQSALKSKQAETDRLVASLKQEGDALRTLLSEKEQQARNLDAELNRIIAAEIERQQAEQRRREEARQKRIAEEKAKKEAAAKAEKERKAKEEKERKAREEKERKAKEQASKGSAKGSAKGGDKTSAATKPETKPAKATATPEPAPKPAPPKPEVERVASSDVNVSGSFESNRGRLPYPVVGSYKIVSHFGVNKHPDLKYVETENSGVDLEVPKGGKARAIFEGTVSAIFRQPGYNTVVMIRHGNYLTIYGGLGSIFVKTGDKVTPNQIIGTVYADPDDGGRSILHFEIRKEKQKLNPEEWMR